MSNFQRFFWRGLGILLPSLLTIWLLVFAYTFLHDKIAEPINAGVREGILLISDWPRAEQIELTMELESLREKGGAELQEYRDRAKQSEAAGGAYLTERVRRNKLQSWWASNRWGMDLIGLVVAIVLVYIVGIFLGSFIGRRLLHRLEALINRLPLVRRVYPAVKQVTDFFVGQQKPASTQFSRVVAVEYPRKGIWSLGLVTGSTMRTIQESVGGECLTVFIPNSPTPFTGFVITVPKADSIDLGITIEEALKFVISGGVLVPPSQSLEGAEGGPDGDRVSGAASGTSATDGGSTLSRTPV